MADRACIVCDLPLHGDPQNLDLCDEHVKEAVERRRAGVLPYIKTCPRCNYQTNIKGDLTAHKKAHHAKH